MTAFCCAIAAAGDTDCGTPCTPDPQRTTPTAIANTNPRLNNPMCFAPQFPDVVPQPRIYQRYKLRRIAPLRIELFRGCGTEHICSRHPLADVVVETNAQSVHHGLQLIDVGLRLDWTAGGYHLRFPIRQAEQQFIRASSDEHCARRVRCSVIANSRWQTTGDNPASGRPILDR